MIALLKSFYPYLKQYKRPLSVAFVCMVIMDISSYGIPMAIGYVTDRIFPHINESGMLNRLVLFFFLLVGLGLFRGLMIRWMIRNYWYVSESLVRDLRNALYQKLQHLDLSFYDQAKTGDLMSRVTYDIQQLRNFFSYGLEHRIRLYFITLTVFIFMLLEEWRLAVAIYLFIPAIIIIILSFVRRMDKAVKARQNQMGQLNSRLQENITGIRVVKALSMETQEIERFEKENKTMLKKDLGVSLLQAYLNPILLMTDGIGSLVILLYGGYQVINGTLTLGILIAFISYLGIMRFPIMVLAGNTSLVSQANGAGNRIFQILNSPDQKRYNTGQHKGTVEGEIEFDNVSFGYYPNTAVLKNLSFQVDKGERVALFGLTGAGKSTLISLIPRFYPPDSGVIRIDGHNVDDWELHHLRTQVGTVLQETFLFSATIAENIAFGKPGADIEEIKKVAGHTQLDSFIESLPQGYDTIIGEYGVGLSGGQRQRIAIARTLLQDPKILILDDCTSSLDSVTERKIQEQLRELMKDRTTIIIAQRVSALALAERIIVLEGGEIQAMDSHDNLLVKNPFYRSIYEAQTYHPGRSFEVSTN